ncbi:uncharacterized protein TNCV_781961 [Trichonephila clavipes]|nr:uncharacterized protein TNCV_781961 [Trichonephila clavipes]
MMTHRKWNTYDFLTESQKLIERVHTSKNASLTPLVKRLSNISKYSGHLPDIACYDGNPGNQGLVGVDGPCINSFFIWRQRKKYGHEKSGEVLVNSPDQPVQSISLDMLYAMHFAHLC